MNKLYRKMKQVQGPNIWKQIPQKQAIIIAKALSNVI